jgi:hypothetical protein
VKVLPLLVAAGAAFYSLTCAAVASDVPTPSALTIKAGAGAESNAKNVVGFAGGIDYIFHPSGTLQPFNASVYADFLGHSSFGFGVAIRNAGPAYIGAGAGLYSMSVTPPGGGPVFIGGGSSSPTYTASGFGGKLFGGFSVAPLTSVELAYHFTPYTHGYQTNVLTAELAVRL